jgi:6-phosphogluconolactonase
VDDGSSAISQSGTGAAGALSPLSPRAVPTGSDNSFNVAVTPNGTSAYVTNGLLRSVSQYTINSTDGTLSAMSPPIVATGADNYGGAVSPDGKNAYVTNAIDNTVSQSNINSLTGALTPKVPAPVPTGSIPQSIVVSPNGANASPRPVLFLHA